MTLNPYQVYQQNAVMTAKPGELTAMLYDGLARFLYQARQAIDMQRIAEANHALLRAQDIVNYLAGTLDLNYEISASLGDLYNFMLRRLVEANLKKDSAVVEEVLDLVKDLSAAWREAMKRAV
ncbi:flagellar export chaperone FliS [Moorella sp. Hama-1]|uniref:flagellar export chaperone FliS n=1 Tax=Moorella sp. Hama-1 TaxID=2138101 RepID=UPI000D659360|nr:flagellar export chaperone FliS [Moorella sp. Hama-1]BCV20800.1 flagellar export chaperone FliS [Moorella sp. Hama-1]